MPKTTTRQATKTKTSAGVMTGLLTLAIFLGAFGVFLLNQKVSIEPRYVTKAVVQQKTAQQNDWQMVVSEDKQSYADFTRLRNYLVGGAEVRVYDLERTAVFNCNSVSYTSYDDQISCRTDDILISASAYGATYVQYMIRINAEEGAGIEYVEYKLLSKFIDPETGEIGYSTHTSTSAEGEFIPTFFVNR